MIYGNKELRCKMALFFDTQCHTQSIGYTQVKIKSTQFQILQKPSHAENQRTRKDEGRHNPNNLNRLPVFQISQINIRIGEDA